MRVQAYIPMGVFPGARVNTKAFGPGVIQRIITLRSTRHSETIRSPDEVACGVRCDSGELLYLSLQYVQKVLA